MRTNAIAAGATAGAAVRARVGHVVLAHAGLARLYSTIPLALLAHAVGVASGGTRIEAAAAAAAIAFALASGYAYNDLRDQPLDRLNRPSRPLVSGVLTERYVRHLTVVLAGAALLVAWTTGVRTFAFTALLLASAYVYSDRIKRLPALKNAFVGVWCGLLPWSAALDRFTAAALPAVALVALFIAQKELVADVHDRHGDAAAGVRTIPVLYGARAALALTAALNAASWLLARAAPDVPVLAHLPRAAAVAAVVNVVASMLVLWRPTAMAVRAHLELQKVFMVGGCLSLVAMLGR